MNHLYIILLIFAHTALRAQTFPYCPDPRNVPVTVDDVVHETVTPVTTPPPAYTPPSDTGDRMVYWVHGLGGNQDSWAKVSNATASLGDPDGGYDARRVFSADDTYSEFTLPDAGQDLQEWIRDFDGAMDHDNMDPLRGIAIGHSQGGLVIRALDRLYANTTIAVADRRFQGIVTFGTPHQGAQILNNLDEAFAFANQACTDITAGPLAEWLDDLQSNFLLDWIIPDETILNIRDQLCGLVANEVIPYAFASQTAAITEDYQVGATEIAALNNAASFAPYKVAFYGVEDEPQLYKVLYSFFVKEPNEFDVFKAGYDSLLVKKADSIRLENAQKYIFYTAQVTMLEDLYGMPCDDPWPWIHDFSDCVNYNGTYNDAVALRDAWKTSYDWWQTANDRYLQVIGALVLEPYTEGYCSCRHQITDYDGNVTYEEDWVEDTADSDNCTSFSDTDTWNNTVNCNWVTEVRYNLTYKENDGVVLAESAMGFPGASYVVKLDKSNHQQMRNDENTKEKLNGLWNGAYGDFFITQAR